MTTPNLCLLEPHWYELRDDFLLDWEKDGVYHFIRINEGFQCDLSSVPPLFWSVINPQSLSLIAPLVHDAFYACGGDVKWSNYLHHYTCKKPHYRVTSQEKPWTQRDVDRLFCRLMRDENVAQWKRRSAFKAVKWFGFWGFPTKRRGNQKPS